MNLYSSNYRKESCETEIQKLQKFKTYNGKNSELNIYISTLISEEGALKRGYLLDRIHLCRKNFPRIKSVEY